MSLWSYHWRLILIPRNIVLARRVRAPWRSEHFWVVALAGFVFFIEWGAPGQLRAPAGRSSPLQGGDDR